MNMQSLTLFCGSSTGSLNVYREAAGETGRYCARNGISLVYGGGNIGLMGIAADACLAEGGTVTGVIPRSLLERELAHQGCGELIVVETMEERKAIMIDRADAFIALPGGMGTYDEIFEVLTGFQLSFHNKPLGLLNSVGYYDPFFQMMERTMEQGFLQDPLDRFLSVSPSVPELFSLLDARLA
jgi:uncharacterized protein (TIGR00730 family)